MKFIAPIKVTVLTIATATILSGLMIGSSKAAFASAAAIGQQLINAAKAAGVLNLTLTHDPYIDTLRNSRSNVISVNLYSGVAYNLVSVCDEYCRDVDLKLYDENYNLIDYDTGSNDFPVISVVPRWSGRFTLKLT